MLLQKHEYFLFCILKCDNLDEKIALVSNLIGYIKDKTTEQRGEDCIYNKSNSFFRPDQASDPKPQDNSYCESNLT